MKYKSILLFMLICFVSFGLSAFKFEPIIQDFTPSGINSRRSFLITNSDSEPIAVKISMVYRDMDLNGKEALTDASDVFFIFPSQLIVQPESNQIVRVQWLGNSTVTTEQPFRIIAEQLPINMNRDQSGVNILLAYHGSIYVVPDEFSFGIEVLSVKKDKNEAGEDILQIELENTGNTHMILSNPEIQISDSSAVFQEKSFTLTADELIGLTDQNILAGKKRLFSVPWPDALSNGNLNATLRLDPVR